MSKNVPWKPNGRFKPPFEIEYPEIKPSALSGQGKELVQEILEGVADQTVAIWRKLALDRLGTSSATYIQAIQKPEIFPGYAVVSLVGNVADKIENGSPAYDMRTTLLGPRVKVIAKGQRGPGKYQAKDGSYYRPIPFRHSVPGSQKQVGQVMGDAYEGKLGKAKAKELGKRIHKAAKGLTATIEGKNRSVLWGGRLRAKMAPKLKKHHATDIFAGMVKVQKQYGVGQGTKYMTFRMISTRVMRGWFHKATPGIHLLKQVQAEIDRMVPTYVQDLFDAIAEEEADNE